MHKPSDPLEGEREFDRLPFYAKARLRKLSELLHPFVEASDLYARLICRLTSLLGQIPPAGPEELARRDLLADSFDFLYEARRVLLTGYVSVAYPLSRRAYESISLFNLCCVDGSAAARWQAGKRIPNAEVRRALSKAPLPVQESALRDLYEFFSRASHPNRDSVAGRHLGGGNEFVLGAIGRPDLRWVVDHCIRQLGLWFWLGVDASYFYRPLLRVQDRGYMDRYRTASQALEKAHRWLAEEWHHLSQLSP